MKKVLFCVGLLIAGANFSYAQSKFTATRTEIKNGNDVVATYTRSETRENDKVTMIMTFLAKDGSTIAVATIPYQQAGAATTVKTARDGQKHSLTIKGKMDTDMAKEIADLLSEKKYL